MTVTEAKKELLLAVSAELAVEAKDRRALGGRSAVLFRNIEPDDLDTIARVLREAAEGWSFDMDAAPRDGTAVLLFGVLNGPDDGWQAAGIWWNFDWRLAADGVSALSRPVAWRPLPAPPSETTR